MTSSLNAHNKRKLPELAILSRREAFALFGVAAVSISLAGCGDGEGTSDITSGSSDRTLISGDLATQYNQFSTIAENVSNTWLGSSGSLDALRDMQGRSSRAPSDSKIVMQVLGIGVNAARSAYERLCNLALMLDDLGIAASAVNKNNSLNSSNAVNNEQWLAAMIAQNYAALSVTGTLFVIQQTAGLPEARAWALGRTTESSRLAAYGLVADVFNAWVDALTSAGNIKPKDAWKLDLTGAVTSDNIGDKLKQIDVILPQLPFSPGYRKPGASLSQLDDDSLGATGIQNFAQTFSGAFSQLILNSGALTDTFLQTIDVSKAHYDVAARLGQTGIGQKIAGLVGGIASAQQAIDALLASTDGTTWPGLTGASAQCQVQIVVKTYGFLQALSTAIISTKSALGSVITGAQAVQFLAEVDTTIATCGSPLQQSLWNAVKADRDLLKSQQLFNGSVPTTRQVSVVTVTGRSELDQIGAAGVTCTNKLIIGVPDICPLDPKNPAIKDYRVIISGLGKIQDCPRTFRNVLICVSGLLYNLALLYPDTLAASWDTDSSLKFCSTNFARMLLREPQVAFAEVPAITSAQLLCTAVGYIPSRSLTPVNLGSIPNLPDLSQITNLVGGVPINVH